MKLNGLEKYFKTNEHDEIVDFKQVDKYRKNALMLAFRNNTEENLHLNHDQFDYLIKNSNLTQVDEFGWNALMIALRNNKDESLNLTKKQWDYLINNSDLTQLTKLGWNTLRFALINNNRQELNLTHHQWKHLLENSDLSLIIEKEHLLELKKIQSELLSDEILNKIEMNKNNNDKKVKI